MKLITSNLFDVSSISTTDSFKQLQPFFSHYNTLTDDVVKTLRNGASSGDNLNSQKMTLAVFHGKPINISLNISPLCLFVASGNIPIRSYTFLQLPNTQYSFTVYFDQVIPIIAYGAQWVSGNIIKITVPEGHFIRVGDVITTNDFKWASNNGTFLVLQSNTSTLLVTNPSRADASQDEIYTSQLGFSNLSVPLTLTIIS